MDYRRQSVRTAAPRRLYQAALAALALAVFVLGTAASVDGCTPARDPRFVGTATCMTCHKGITASDLRDHFAGPHAAIDCETCHGPGLEHVRAGGRNGILIDNPGDDPFGATPDLCARCHADAVDGHAMTTHFTKGAASCNDCHNVHKPGGFVFASDPDRFLDNAGYVQLCGECHAQQTGEFLRSGHATKDAVTCGGCHDLHVPATFTAPPENNQLCQQCHASFFLGLDSPEAVDFHTGAFHPVDPAGSGASRCVTCHLPPQRRTNQDRGPHDHSLLTLRPAETNALIAQGMTPPPNSCAGILGCHDASVPGSGAPFNLDHPSDNTVLQRFFDQIGGIPEKVQ